MLKIDIHTHIIPKNLPDYSKKFGYEGFVNLVNINDSEANMILFNENFRTVQCNCWSPTQRLKEYNKFNIDVQVISPIPIMFSYWADPKDALEVSQFINDFIASVCSENPKKFIGLGTVPMQSTKEAIKELERCKYELNLPGIEIGSNINDENLIKQILGSSIGNNCISFSKMKIAETIPIIASCQIYIGSDTGWGHIASGLGLKSLFLFMDSPPLAYGVYSKNISIIVPQGETIESCGHNTRGKDKISYDEVLTKTLELIN